MLPTQVIQKIQLIEGQFTASEASDLIGALIDEKINFHKIQRLGQFIHNDCADANESRARIDELTNDKKIAKEFISKARVNGRKITISSKIEITYED